MFAPSLRERGLLLDDEVHLRPRQTFAQVLANRRAALFIGVWLLTNALFGALGTPLDVADAGIAWEAHLGGFLAGFVLFPLLDPFARPSDRRRPKGLPRRASFPKIDAGRNAARAPGPRARETPPAQGGSPMTVEHILSAKGHDVFTIEPECTLADAARLLPSGGSAPRS